MFISYNVLNILNSAALNAFNKGGTPFSPQYMPFNAPFGAQCANAFVFSCTAESRAALWYLNYKPDPLDNISWRFEWFHDVEGQRTGTKTMYIETGIGSQHWFSQHIAILPEISFYRSLNAPAFNGNFNLGIPQTKNVALIGSADIIVHF